MKNLRVTVDGKVFTVTVEMLDEPTGTTQPKQPAARVVPSPSLAPAPETAPTPTVAASSAGVAGGVPSPLTGKIVSIEVAVGQSVAEGDKIATIEAMKMNTYVFAPKAGKVTSIVAAAGTSIEEGGTLLVIG